MIGLEMAKQEHVEYQFYEKTFRSHVNDTSYAHGEIYFETNPKDTAIGYNVYASVSMDYQHNEIFYNGDYVINLFTKDSFVMMRPLSESHYPCLEKSYGVIKLFLTDTLFASMTDSLTRKDTVMNQQPCVMFSFWADSKLIDIHKKGSGKEKVNLIFRKNDVVPLLYSTYVPLSNGGYSYEESLFSDYRFDVTYPSSMFAIENIPSYYQWNKIGINTLPVGTRAPDWKQPKVDGDSIALSDFRGKYVLLNFWFMGCGACIQSYPVLNELKLEYEGKMEVIGINCFSKNAEEIGRYCLTQGMNYTNVWNGDDEVSKKYAINAAPIFYLIDQNDVIVDTWVGANNQELKNRIAKVIKK